MAVKVRSRKNLTARQRRAIAALIAGRSRVDAAAAGGVTARTLRRWLEMPHFRSALHQEGDAIIAGAARQARAEVDSSLRALVHIRDDPEEPAGARVRAADLILQHAGRLLELTEIQERLQALEMVTDEIGDLVP